MPHYKRNDDDKDEEYKIWDIKNYVCVAQKR